MMEGAAVSELMVKADFGDGVFPSVPADLKGRNFGTPGIINRNDGNRNINSKMHTRVYPNNTRRSIRKN